MNYIDYSVEDFALDAHFQLWVQYPDKVNSLFWQQWLKEHPEKLETVEQARHLILLFKFREDVPAAGVQEQVWERITASRLTREQGNVRQHRPESKWQAFGKWAAVAVLLLVSGLLVYLMSVDRSVLYTTGFGQSRNILLADGTTVILNANSTLKVSPNWWGWGVSREVHLDGEAFFKVVKKAGFGDKRFVVHTRKLDVEVLGTQFNVFSRERGSQVVLNSGRVKLDVNHVAPAGSILMKPGELVALDASAVEPVKKRVDPERYNDWTRKQWVMDGTTLLDVTDRLEETFGLSVSFGSQDIAQERMTGVISIENLDELLDALAKVNELQVRREGSRLLFER